MVRQVLNYHDVQLYDTDVQLFPTHQWLNDNAVNFYFQYLYHTVCLPAARSDVLLMDPAVVSCMMLQCDGDDEYEDLGRGLGVAHKSLCLIPVNDNQAFDQESSHWSLLVYRKGRFTHYDSSAGHNTSAAKRIAKNFLRLLNVCGAHEIPPWFAECFRNATDAPQQMNGYDCGMYLLVTAEFVCRNYIAPIKQSLHEYVTPARITSLRQEIPVIVDRLIEEESS